jgi:hypothetical protein
VHDLADATHDEWCEREDRVERSTALLVGGLGVPFVHLVLGFEFVDLPLPRHRVLESVELHGHALVQRVPSGLRSAVHVFVVGGREVRHVEHPLVRCPRLSP